MANVKNWNRAYHEMFRRIREQLLQEQRAGARYMSPEKIDARAWRDAMAYAEGAIRREDEADAIAKHRRGEAA
jgi:hypothetical protein